MAPGRVTVIDDSYELLDLLGEALRATGSEVELRSGAATILELEESRPDVLIVDLRLGRESLSGWEIVSLCRDHPTLRKLPIIVCSAAVDEISRYEDEMDADPHTFLLRKPFSVESLETLVGLALGTDVGAPMT